MLPTTIFRQTHRPGMCKGLTDLLRTTREGTCLNRYAAATGLLKTSFLDYQRWDIVSLRLYANSKKQSFQLRTIKSRDLIQSAIEKKRESFIERKNVLVKDIRETKSKVRERMEEVIVRENIMTIPNMLTVGRAFLAPYIGYVIFDGDFNMAIGLLVVAGITDLLDGQIARHWPSQASKAGSFLDPMADKLLIGSLVISMGYCDLLPLWLAGTILFRDAFLLGAGFVIRYISLPPPFPTFQVPIKTVFSELTGGGPLISGRKALFFLCTMKTLSRYFDATHVTAQLEPTLISKVNTFVQLTAIGLSLGAPVWHYLDHSLLHGLWYLTGATTVAAALSYVLNKNTYKILQKQT